MDGTPFKVLETPQPPIGEEVSDGKEGEENSNSSCFVAILKNNSRRSPPLTRGRKSHKERRVKEAESSNYQESMIDFMLR